MLVQDKARVEAEVIKLREELINTVSKVNLHLHVLIFRKFVQSTASQKPFPHPTEPLHSQHLSPQLTSEKERSVARLAEERERAERDQHAALAEAVKGQAVLRAEMAAMVQRVKVRICLYSYIIAQKNRQIFLACLLSMLIVVYFSVCTERGAEAACRAGHCAD